MKISNEKLKELLIRPGHINEADFESAAKEAEDSFQKNSKQSLCLSPI